MSECFETAGSLKLLSVLGTWLISDSNEDCCGHCSICRPLVKLRHGNHAPLVMMAVSEGSVCVCVRALKAHSVRGGGQSEDLLVFEGAGERHHGLTPS